jgi:predicted metal-dependent hydrolase
VKLGAHEQLELALTTGRPVEVVRSRRRRKTVQAHEVDGTIRISIPASMSKAEEQHWVDEMVRRFDQRAAREAVDLTQRAASLAARYRLPRPASIRWVDNQHDRWASCTIDDRSIRVSSRLAAFPRWVLDYVLVHELAHLVEPNHDAAFWTLVTRYPRTERARGYLLAKEDA